MTSPALSAFADAVQCADVDIELDVAALLIGAWDHDDLDLTPYRRRLDGIATRAAEAINGAKDDASGPGAPARAIAATLFADLGFRGNATEYYDPRNSFLREVLDRRVGIPITLSVLYLEIARRVGVRAAGVGFPGHFLVRVDDGPSPLILDPFHAGVEVDRPELQTRLAQASGPEAQLDETSLLPTSKRAILTRMLNNLAGIYGSSGDLHRSLEVLERLAVLDAANPRISAALDQLRRKVEGLN